MQDRTPYVHELFNALIGIIEKYNAIEKSPRVYGKEMTVFPSQIRVIVTIGHETGINVTELAKRLEITKPSASEAVGKLVKQGLVRKTRDAGNDKEVVLSITERCRGVLAEVDRRHERMFKDFTAILGEFGSADCGVMIRVLRRIEHYLNEFGKEGM
jgi:DNA-binding MarR family transcriptional regulator